VPLFTIETEGLRLAWRGEAAPEDPSAPEGRLRVWAEGSARVRVGDRQAEGVEVSLPLALAEQTPYRLLLQSLGEAPVSLAHPDPALLAGLSAEDGGRVVYGDLDFQGQIGRSPFEVRAGGEALRFEVEVFPTKVSLADVDALRAEVDEACTGLALEYLRATLSPALPTGALPRRASWLTLLRLALPDLEAALAEVARQPARDLRRTTQPTRAERVRRPDAAVRRALRAGGGHGERLVLEGGIPARAVLPAHHAEASADTPEHRWLRARLDHARAALDAIRLEEAALPETPRRRQVSADLDDARRRVGRLLALEPLREASPGPPPSPTPRLLTAPGYAEAHAALRRLDLGLVLAEGPVPQATRDLPLLYEVWAYLATARQLADLLGEPLPAEAFFRAEEQGVRLLLRRGRSHALRFEREGVRVALAYNPRLDVPGGLLAQRPDLLLTIEASGRPARWIVLDAKYRREDAPRYVRRYGAPGPPEDALGTLHRYRDAIVGPGGHRPVEAAAALYPYRAEASFEQTRLWRTLGGLGVGAIPLLPGHTGWLRRWLEGLLAEASRQ
jgi:uncharacterized protein